VENEPRRQQTIQEKVASWTNDADGLELGLFRVDPPKPLGQVMSYHVSLHYRSSSTPDLPVELSVDDRSRALTSILHTINRLLNHSDDGWSRERRQLSHCTELVGKLRDNMQLLLYSRTGTLLSRSLFVRTPEEADELWQRYQNGELEKEIRAAYSDLYLPFGPVDITLKVYDYEECKRCFQFAGYRLLYILYPHINKKRNF
jgi:hypothetical protein